MTDVLAVLNRFRKEHFDLEPLEEMPKGVKSCSTGCPVAEALPHGWEVGTSWILDAHDNAIKLPDELVRFIIRFDDGAFPELVAA